MGMGHTVKCAFRLTSLLKKAERSFHQKGKAVDHSHPAVPSLTLPDIDCSDHGLRPLCKEMGMDAYNKDTFSDSDSDSDTNTDTDTDTSSVFIPDLAVRAKPADADADADAVAGSSSNHPITVTGNASSASLASRASRTTARGGPRRRSANSQSRSTSWRGVRRRGVRSRSCGWNMWVTN